MAFLLNNDHHPIKPALSPTYSWSMVVTYYVIPIEIQYVFEQKLKVPRLCSYHLVIKRGWLENPYKMVFIVGKIIYKLWIFQLAASTGGYVSSYGSSHWVHKF